jgi:hypothetical protein
MASSLSAGSACYECDFVGELSHDHSRELNIIESATLAAIVVGSDRSLT